MGEIQVLLEDVTITSRWGQLVAGVNGEKINFPEMRFDAAAFLAQNPKCKLPVAVPAGVSEAGEQVVRYEWKTVEQIQDLIRTDLDAAAKLKAVPANRAQRRAAAKAKPKPKPAAKKTARKPAAKAPAAA